MAGREVSQLLPAVALGKFDALHLGHRALARAACAQAGQASLISFSGMAAVLGWPERLPLVAAAQRVRILAGWSQELQARVIETLLDFREVRELQAGEFLNLLRERFGTRTVVVGEDFRGGRDRATGASALQDLARPLGMQVEVVAPVLLDGTAVSSSAVRSALAAGDVALARRLLGRPHAVAGLVVRGDGRGRSIGIPTANCAARANQEPGPGVYAGLARVGDGLSVPAAINIGHQPTVAANRHLTVEAHLIRWQGDCYGKPLELSFLTRLREERKFPSLEALVQQVQQDIRQADRIASPAAAPASTDS